MQELYTNTSSTCRLCLHESEFQVLIFGDIGHRLGVHFKIQSCFPTLQVTQHDGLPNSICYRCLFSLEQTYDFWTKCCTSEAILSNSRVQRHGHQVICEEKRIRYQPKEATMFPHTSDDTDWDEWFIWDATYKISQTENKCSQHMSTTAHPKNPQVDRPSLMCKSVLFGDTNEEIQMRKQNNEDSFKNDFLQEDIPWINEKNDIMKVTDIGKPTQKMNAGNFSSSFWKQKSSSSMIQTHPIMYTNSEHSPFVKSNKTFTYSNNSEQMDLSEILQDKKRKSKLFNQYGCQDVFSTNSEITSKENFPFTYNTNSYDDVLAKGTDILQRLRANNSLYH